MFLSSRKHQNISPWWIWKHFYGIIQCANITKTICIQEHGTALALHLKDIRLEKGRHVFFFARIVMLCISLKLYGVKFLPPLPSVESAIWQLLASLSGGSSVSSDMRLTDLQPIEDSCSPAVDMLPLRGYTHEMTPSHPSLAGMESYIIARCVCQPEVKGHPSANDHGSLWKRMKWLMFILLPLVILNFL